MLKACTLNDSRQTGIGKSGGPFSGARTHIYRGFAAPQPRFRCWQMDEALQEQGRIPCRQVCPEMGPSLTYVCANHIIISRLMAALLSGLLKEPDAVE